MDDRGGGAGHRGTRAIQRMVEFAPSTGGLALRAGHHDLPAGTPAAPIATDGETLFYGAAFERLPLELQTGLVAHQVLHVALRHPQRMLALRERLGDVDPRLFNLCADAIVDSTLGHLGWLKLPVSSVGLDRLLMTVLGIAQHVEVSLLEWDVERLYRAIDDRNTPTRRGGGGSRGLRGGGAGRARPDPGAAGRRPDAAHTAASTHAAQTTPAAQTSGPNRSAAPSEDGPREDAPREDGPLAARARALLPADTPLDLIPAAGDAQRPEHEAQRTRDWQERLLRAHAGDGAFSMLRNLIADLARSRTPWEQVLRTQLARGLARRAGLSWSRPARSYIANQGRAGPHRRMPWEPGQTPSRTAPRLAVVVDVSGSIDDALMMRFAREVAAIARRLEAGLILVVGDDRVRRVAYFQPGHVDLAGIDFHGGGGTDFTPLLVEADGHRPDIGVVLTDLEGPATFRPRWPVVWAVPPGRAAPVAPFGRLLRLD
jgi:predicted metal-dependent peptidase